MTRCKALASVVLALGIAATLTLGACAPAKTVNNLNVVTSTSLIAQIVTRVGGDKVSVINIIPPAQCPGHFDVKPGDIQRLADADLFLLHGWQGEKFSQELIDSADNPDLTVVSLDIQTTESDNWMVPSVQREATDKITAALCQVDSENSAAYQQRAADYSNVISAKEAELRSELDQVDFSTINVMCAEMQAGFVGWLGFNIVTSYGRPDSFTPQVVRELVDAGREAGVSLIIDNLQSGQDAAKAVAEELGCTRIILSNFPGGFTDTETWEKAIDKNVALVLEALGQNQG
ncbi:MAG TPA: zinc ABC transporter substrate-binding protein [Dehalococcoidia bacterium]|nr:zinc ABC transporter substrate-binding protein [Dehalococcoidia bacterium]